MLEIFTKDALCLRFLNTLLTLAWRAPDIGEFLSRMMEIANSHNKINELNGWRRILWKEIAPVLWELHLQVARVHSLINTHRVWMLWTRGVEGLEAGDGQQKWWCGCWLDLGLPVEKFSQSNVVVCASTLTRYYDVRWWKPNLTGQQLLATNVAGFEAKRVSVRRDKQNSRPGSVQYHYRIFFLSNDIHILYLYIYIYKYIMYIHIWYCFFPICRHLWKIQVL